MRLNMLRLITTVLALVLTAGTAFAQEETADEEESAEEASETEEGVAEQPIEDEQADAEEAEPEPTEPVRSNTDPFEEPDKDYYFLGAFYRHVMIPTFIQNLFVNSTVDGSNPGVGLMFNWRRNNLNVGVEAWWNNAQASGTFLGLGDPEFETEWVDVNLWVFFINVSIMWAFPITDWFAVELGIDLGLGFVGGDLVRTEAYRDADGNWQRCNGPGDPASGAFCEPAEAPPPCYNNNGGHYNCREPNWTTPGGDVPVVMPWISLPRIALRFKPIHQLQIRVEGGYGLYNFFFGGSLAYGF